MEEIMKEWMAWKMEANEQIKDQMECKMFAYDVLPNHVGDKEFKSIDGIGIGRMPKIKKDNMAMPKEYQQRMEAE
nr:hypothetical protein [Tanacetum cinerariifolium]